MQSTLLFVTEKEAIFDQVNNFFKIHAPHVELVFKTPQWHELQSLEEERVIQHKAMRAWDHFRQPLIVEDSGFYFKHYPDFPGTLSEFALSGLAREGISKLCRADNRASAYSWIGYIGQNNADCYFNARVEGYIIDEFAPEMQTNFDMTPVFHPEGSTKTLQQLIGSDKEALFSPRLKASKKFVNWYLDLPEDV